MSDCETYQMSMDEVLAFGGTPSDFPEECTEHIAHCESCSAFLDESLALGQLLEDPIPFPPVNLTEQVMERIAESEKVEVGLPWTERLAWAILQPGNWHAQSPSVGGLSLVLASSVRSSGRRRRP